MDVIVTGKNMQVGESLTEHIEKTINQLLEKYFSGRGEATIILTKQTSSMECDVKIHLASGMVLHAHSASHSDAASVFAETEEKIAKQLRRYKRRLQDFERNDNPKFQTTEYVLEHQEAPEENSPEDQEHLVIAEHSQAIETLTVSDAVMRMDLGDLNHLLFRNVGNTRLNLVYRRADGHCGWLNPEQ